jgi:calcium-dependent protein kinase
LLISGEPPFNGKDHTEILAKVREGVVKFDQPIWQTVSEPAKEFIKSLLQPEE